MPAPDMIDIRNWRTDTGREPVVRVGIVLDEDARSNLELGIPQEDYRLTAQGGPGEVRHAMPVVARLTGGAIAVRAGDEAERVASVWHIAPVRAQSLQHGQGILVRNVMVGRGFHWQKRVDQTLCGRIELHAGRRGLIVVNELPLERYLAGVITAEMSGRCPNDFLRAQCVVARSWLLAFTEAKHEDDPFDRCNDDCCQRYQGTGDLTASAIEAVASTRGLALVDTDGNVVDANYSKCCGGITESPEHVWDRSKPGLSAVADMPPGSPARRFFPLTENKLDEYLDGEWLRETDIYCSPNAVPQDRLGEYLGRVDEGGRYFRWTVTHGREELEALLRAGLEQTSDLVRLWDLKVVERGVSGRAGEIALDFENGAGRRRSVRVRSEYRIREVLHPKFLYSSAFVVRIERDAHGVPATVTLRGAGWGHGAGMCQIGALGMALKGIGFEPILRHYYPRANLQRVYD